METPIGNDENSYLGDFIKDNNTDSKLEINPQSIYD